MTARGGGLDPQRVPRWATPGQAEAPALTDRDELDRGHPSHLDTGLVDAPRLG